MKTRLSSTEPPAPTGYANATISEVLEDGVRKIAVWVPSSGESRWWARAILSGYQPPDVDVLVNRYRVILDADQIITLLKVGTTAKLAPSGSDFVGDVLRSNDDGATWQSIFNVSSPIDGTEMAYIAAGNYKGDQLTFAIGELHQDDLIRIDVLVNDDAVGIEIVLEGIVSAVASPA